ncbi:hypothetical protein JTB14_005531 [Gonioctena quinquepunctata]|nr:hypothetical protein JTB14_005531 [Gonioctena quinquepunctata]
MSQLNEIKTFVFLDTETTGLPSEEGNKTKITELSMVAVQACHIRLGVFPRVQNKLNFCFNPRKMISLGSEDITGLSNFILEHSHSFSEETVTAINSFLNHNPQPICFVAHNGNNFDYPLLKTEINKTKSSIKENILCIDSLVTFRDFHLQEMKGTEEVDGGQKNPIPFEFYDQYDSILCDAAEKLEQECIVKALEVQKINETTPKKRKLMDNPISSTAKKKKEGASARSLNFGVSFKLCDIYTRLTNRPPKNLHHAEGDVLMLITCAATLGDKFVDWANENAKNFSEIPPMLITVSEQYASANLSLFGDFNFPSAIWDVEDYCSVAFPQLSATQAEIDSIETISNICALLNLFQSNEISNNRGVIILSPLDITVMKAANILIPEDSHHPLLQCNLPLKITNEYSSGEEYYYDFPNADFAAIRSSLEAIDWVVHSMEKSSDMVSIFYDILYSIIDFSAKKICQKNFRVGTPELKKLLYEKKSAHKFFKSARCPESYAAFSNLRSRCKFLARQCYADYIQRTEHSIIK